jgi:hypothetical protein
MVRFHMIGGAKRVAILGAFVDARRCRCYGGDTQQLGPRLRVRKAERCMTLSDKEVLDTFVFCNT